VTVARDRELLSDGGPEAEDGAVYRVDVAIETPIQPTEVPDRVQRAVASIFPEADLERTPTAVRGDSHSLSHFSERLHQQAILDTARDRFFETLAGDTFTFRLKKQPAVEGTVTFAVGEPDELGEIEVRVMVQEPDAGAFIDHVAPATVDGVPVTDRESSG
jgi:predicted RNA binding protein with dsRBD fold (UPF0201 family)